MSHEGLPPAHVPPKDARRFELECLEYVRKLLAPGAALRTEMQRVAHKQLLSIEIDQDHTPVEIVVELVAGGERSMERFSVWGLDAPPPNPYAPHEAQQVATIIAANVAEP
jgi:hypothetical protein